MVRDRHNQRWIDRVNNDLLKCSLGITAENSTYRQMEKCSRSNESPSWTKSRRLINCNLKSFEICIYNIVYDLLSIVIYTLWSMYCYNLALIMDLSIATIYNIHYFNFPTEVHK